MDTKTASQKTAHHHGDLREALIQAGTALIREDGEGALTIRGVAARAGVSHAAPKHHFPTLLHLRTAIAARAHSEFAETMEQAIAELPTDNTAGARDVAVAACKGYFRFAKTNPGLFQVMFEHQVVDRNDPALAEASSRSYGVLAKICAPFSDSGRSLPVEMLVWSFAHGFATLATLGQFKGVNDAELESWIDRIFPVIHPEDTVPGDLGT